MTRAVWAGAQSPPRCPAPLARLAGHRVPPQAMISHHGGLWPLLEAAKVSGAHVALLLHGVSRPCQGWQRRSLQRRGESCEGFPVCALPRGVCTQLSSSPKPPYLHPSLQRDEIKTRAGLPEEGREGRSKNRGHGDPEPAAPREQGWRAQAPQAIPSLLRTAANLRATSSAQVPLRDGKARAPYATIAPGACSQGQR